MTDWIGKWFEIQEERGHSDRAPFYLVHLAQKKFEDFSFHHRDQDGVAGLTRALASLGLERKSAASRRMTRPPWLWVAPLLWRGIRGQSERPHPNWRNFFLDEKAKPTHFSFLFLREEACSALHALLAREKISLSAYLLSRLTPALEKNLLNGPARGSWLIPVDMRAAFPERGAAGNCVSYLANPASADPAEISARIKSALANREHWSNWWVYHVGRVVGERGMRWLSARSSRRTFWLDSFTDLGDWTPRQAFDPQTIWAIAAPGTPNNPVGCATLAWFGKRSISLRVHPSVTRQGRRVTRDTLARLAKTLARDLGVAESEMEILETEEPGISG